MRNPFFISVILCVFSVAWWLSLDTAPEKAAEVKPQKQRQREKETIIAMDRLASDSHDYQTDTQSADEKKVFDQEQIDYYQLLNFEEFFRNQLALFAQDSEQEKQARIAKLQAKIAQLEQENYLAAEQGMILKLSILEKSLSGHELKVAAKQLKEEYQNKSAAIMAAYARRRDPLLEEYKKQEREILQEVMALSTFPEGLSREQYLRQRLNTARETIYKQ